MIEQPRRPTRVGAQGQNHIVGWRILQEEEKAQERFAAWSKRSYREVVLGRSRIPSRHRERLQDLSIACEWLGKGGVEGPVEECIATEGKKGYAWEAGSSKEGSDGPAIRERAYRQGWGDSNTSEAEGRSQGHLRASKDNYERRYGPGLSHG